jgi:P-type Mg2+ transporter
MSRWLRWLFGAALVGAVVVVAAHFSEGREFLELAREARPLWLIVAVLLQVATYVAQAEVWRAVGRTIHKPLPFLPSLELSLAKLFVDQALPTAGISSSVLIAQSLERRHLPRSAAIAVVALNLVSYHLAYVVCLAAALALASARVRDNWLVATATVLFTLFAIGLIAAVLGLAGRRTPRAIAKFKRWTPVRSAAEFLEDADQNLTRSRRLLFETSAYQIAIVLLDVVTMMALVRSIGAHVGTSGVFVSFMISSLLRTMGFLPGGLGTFEAASVVTLRLAGASTPVALATTLLFRGLSFWLPMVPGVWASKRQMDQVRRRT